MSSVNEPSERLSRRASFDELLSVWRDHDPVKWKENSANYLELGKAFLRKGENLFALDVLKTGVDAIRGEGSQKISLNAIRRQQALAFSRTGAPERARQILEELIRQDESDLDARGILAGIFKSSWRLTRTRADLRMARDIYRAAYEKAAKQTPPDRDAAVYNGINAATTSFFLDELSEMRILAAATRTHCEEKLRGGEDYWALATLGEAALLLGDFDEAKLRYAEAGRVGGDNAGDLAATRRQAREILRHRKDARTLDDCLPIGPVIVFAGHMVDFDVKPGRAARFPATNEAAVKAAIARKVGELEPEASYSSAACGSDILFLEAMREQQRRAEVVLPFGRTEFRGKSVTVAGAEWGERYDKVLNAIGDARIYEVSKTPLEFASASYDYANMVLQGTAAIRAAELDTELVGLAVWDGQAGFGPGGTASIVARWLAAGMRVELIDPSGREYRDFCVPQPIKREGDTRIISVLFADVVHFSMLTEEQLPAFQRVFLPVIADVVKEYEPLLTNTWGDGLFMAFDDPRQAGSFALALQSAIASRDWGGWQLPAELSLRVSLHAGPAYECTNPITGRTDFLGFHVSRGARIEPVTGAGQVWCSREFASVVRAGGIADFVFEYVGRFELPKKSGVIPLYNLRSGAPARRARTA